MKYRNITRSAKTLGLAVICATFFNSCEKDLGLSDDFTTSELHQDGTAKIRFIHAAVDVGGVSIYSYQDNDSTQVNGDSMRYKNMTGYSDVSIGSVDNSFKLTMIPVQDSGTFYTPNITGVIGNYLNLNHTLEKDQKYTCMIVDVLRTDFMGVPVPFNDSSYFVASLTLTENYPAPPQDNCWARFYNLSQSVGPVDLQFTNTNTSQVVVISNAQFAQFPQYTALLNGNYNLEVQQAGSPLVSRSNINFDSGKAYTFYLRGLRTATDDKQLELEYFTNGE